MALKNIGALWLKTREDGTKFFSGTINNGIHGDINIMIFKNEKKESEKSPDYRIAMATDDEKKSATAPKEGESDGEIPF